MPLTDDGAHGLLHAFVLDGNGGAETIDWDGVQRWKPADGVLWINLDYSAPDAQTWLALEAGLDPTIRNSLTDKDPRPHTNVVGDALLLIARGINLNEGAEPEDMVSLRAWIDPHRIITLRRRSIRTLRSIASDLERGKGPATLGDFVAAMIERILEPVTICVDNVDNAVSDCEEQLVAGEHKQLRARLSAMRRRAISLRRFIGPQRDAFGQLASAPVPWLTDRHRARLQESAQRLTRTIEELDAARDRALVASEELTSRGAELANERIYVLSIMTAVFLPLSFVTSLLGVNIGGVPYTDEPAAFWVLCGAFAAAVLAQLWFCRKRGWF